MNLNASLSNVSMCSFNGVGTRKLTPTPTPIFYSAAEWDGFGLTGHRPYPYPVRSPAQPEPHLAER